MWVAIFSSKTEVRFFGFFEINPPDFLGCNQFSVSGLFQKPPNLFSVSGIFELPRVGKEREQRPLPYPVWGAPT